VIPEGDETSRKGPPRPGEHDLLAERRARRAGLGDPVLADRAQDAEAKVRALETHLADLRRRLAEAERERERSAGRLAEHERELLRVKQREYAEQQLRVEAQDDCTRLRRGYRAELHRLDRCLQESGAAGRSAVQRAEERSARAEERAALAERRRAELEAQLVQVRESCSRLERNIAALQDVLAELRATLGREREAAEQRIVELERALERAERSGFAREPTEDEPAQDEEEARREEMAAALAAAVERLRARVATVGDVTVPVVERPPHKHSMSLITRIRMRRKHRRERRAMGGTQPAGLDRPAAAQPPTIQSR
jgi:chromosome segregation ATPase